MPGAIVNHVTMPTYGQCTMCCQPSLKKNAQKGIFFLLFLLAPSLSLFIQDSPLLLLGEILILSSVAQGSFNSKHTQNLGSFLNHIHSAENSFYSLWSHLVT